MTAIPEEYKDLPVVGKCCGKGEVLVKNDTQPARCATSDIPIEEIFSPLFSEFNSSGFSVPGDPQATFIVIVGDPCKYGRYVFFRVNEYAIHEESAT